MADELTDGQRRGQTAIHELLSAHVDDVGPAGYEDGDPPKGTFMLPTDWVMVIAWVDADGGTYQTRLSSEKLPEYRRRGLLDMGLRGFERDND